MELLQVKREVPWNSMVIWKFHGTWCQHHIQWNYMESPDLEQKFHGIPWNLKSSIEFGYKTKFHGIPCNHYNQLRSSMEFHGLFHGIPWTLVPPNEISLSSMEFPGTLRLPFCSVLCYSRLLWDIPWNSMELWSRQIKKITECEVISWS